MAIRLAAATVSVAFGLWADGYVADSLNQTAKAILPDNAWAGILANTAFALGAAAILFAILQSMLPKKKPTRK